MLITIFIAPKNSGNLMGALHNWYECSECGSVISCPENLNQCPACSYGEQPADIRIWDKQQVESNQKFLDTLKERSPEWQRQKQLFDGIEFTVCKRKAS